jgi:hypothetical protein
METTLTPAPDSFTLHNDVNLVVEYISGPQKIALRTNDTTLIGGRIGVRYLFTLRVIDADAEKIVYYSVG